VVGWLPNVRIPKTISRLKDLEYLEIKHCEIDEIPTQLWHLNNLKKLILSSNYIEEFKIPLKDLGARNLESIELQRNNISKLPIKALILLNNLNKIYLLGNKQKEIIANINTDLKEFPLEIKEQILRKLDFQSENKT
jgi:Leucine-rich repeat (LRR) protein